MIVPALSLWQPWAWAVANQRKRFETRGWPCKMRRVIAIHAAAKRFRTGDYGPEFTDFLCKELIAPQDLEYGKILALAELTPSVRTEEIRDRLSDRELAWGNYADGRHALPFSRVFKLPTPIPARGAQRFFSWTVPADIAAQVPFPIAPPSQLSLTGDRHA
jgi:activating signal cointegrator 1